MHICCLCIINGSSINNWNKRRYPSDKLLKVYSMGRCIEIDIYTICCRIVRNALCKMNTRQSRKDRLTIHISREEAQLLMVHVPQKYDLVWQWISISLDKKVTWVKWSKVTLSYLATLDQHWPTDTISQYHSTEQVNTIILESFALYSIAVEDILLNYEGQHSLSTRIVLYLWWCW